MPPEAVQNEQASRLGRLARRGPVLSAQLLTSFQWDPLDRDGVVTKLRKLVAITPDDDLQKADFWFRLGQTCAWLWEHTPPGASAADRQQAEARFSEAVAAYRAALTFKGYDRRDGTLFALARLYLCADDADSASAYVDRLQREYPASRYVPQIDILYGDHLANHDQLAEALAWYSTAAESNDPFTQPYALYRKGWCFLQRADLDAARFAFGEAVRIVETNRSSPNRYVGNQAARDLAAIARAQR
jgi:tetratricopeptide (TPR) repeat protein